MRYSRGTSNYMKRIVLFDPTHIMSRIDLIAIGVERSLEKEFTELILMNP